MNRFARMIFIVAVMVLLSTTVVFAGAQDFTLDNRTGSEITEVYVSPSASDDWQNDVLGEGTLPNRHHVHITFQRNARPTHWDLKVVFADGNSSAWTHFNLKEISTITLEADGTASFE